MKKHKIVERVEQRTVSKFICAQTGCQFKGKESVQGVCHGSKGEIADFDKLDQLDAELTADLEQMREREWEDYVPALEAHYISTMMNWTLCLDELIRLRRDNALLRAKKARK